MTKAPDYEIINCAECNAEILSTKIVEHIEAVHICPLCGMHPSNLDVHMDFWHKDETDRVREDAQDA